jgi:hypothetical protein
VWEEEEEGAARRRTGKKKVRLRHRCQRQHLRLVRRVRPRGASLVGMLARSLPRTSSSEPRWRLHLRILPLLPNPLPPLPLRPLPPYAPLSATLSPLPPLLHPPLHRLLPPLKLTTFLSITTPLPHLTRLLPSPFPSRSQNPAQTVPIPPSIHLPYRSLPPTLLHPDLPPPLMSPQMAGVHRLLKLLPFPDRPTRPDPPSRPWASNHHRPSLPLRQMISNSRPHPLIRSSSNSNNNSRRGRRRRRHRATRRPMFGTEGTGCRITVGAGALLDLRRRRLLKLLRGLR